MKHYTPMADDVMCCLEDAGMLPSGDEYYLASEADARIEQLERALKSCAAVIHRELAERNKFTQTVREALAEADAALTVN